MDGTKLNFLYKKNKKRKWTRNVVWAVVGTNKWALWASF